jgi:PII-like signaling protein
VRIEGDGRLLRVFVGESDTWEGRPLYDAIVTRARQEGIAGATVVRGIEGFGASTHLHTSRPLELSHDLPIVIEVGDTDERIERFWTVLDEMVTGGLVTSERVHVVAYRDPDDPDAPLDGSPHPG